MAFRLTALPTQQAGAQDYPSRPINIMVATAAGGPTDVVARLNAAAAPKERPFDPNRKTLTRDEILSVRA